MSILIYKVDFDISKPATGAGTKDQYRSDAKSVLLNMKNRILVSILLLLCPFTLRAQTSYGRIQTDRISNKQTIIITGATPDVSNGNVFKTNNGALQSKNGSLFQAASINDNSTLPGVVIVGRGMVFGGPDPYVDIRNYGGYLVGSSSFVTTTNGSATVSLSSASNFRNGEYAT